jgi:hypothetical protein
MTLRVVGRIENAVLAQDDHSFVVVVVGILFNCHDIFYPFFFYIR